MLLYATPVQRRKYAAIERAKHSFPAITEKSCTSNCKLEEWEKAQHFYVFLVHPCGCFFVIFLGLALSTYSGKSVFSKQSKAKQKTGKQENQRHVIHRSVHSSITNRVHTARECRCRGLQRLAGRGFAGGFEPFQINHIELFMFP